MPSTGDVARVPPFDPTLTLLQTDFAGDEPIKPFNTASRPKGWRAAPLLDDRTAHFGVKTIDSEAAIGLHGGTSEAAVKIAQGATAVLAQEVRSPFAGTYKLTVQVRGEGATADEFEKLFKRNFSCRLELFQFTEKSKNAAGRKKLADAQFQPAFVTGEGSWQTVELTKEFVNPKPGSNFSFGLGLGVALTVEKTSGDALELPAGRIPVACLRLHDVRLEFIGKERNEKVKV